MSGHGSGDQQVRVLVVEDDEALVKGLVRNLTFEGYEVRPAGTGREALQVFLHWVPHVVVLDLMLPDMSGLEVLTGIRERGDETHVLILSALGSERDRVKGLRAGADDYLPKPFSLDELLARVEAGVRRILARRTAPGRVIRFGDVSVDLHQRRVWKDGREVRLTRREFDILATLLSAPGRAFSREEIIRRVWGWDYEGTDRTVDNFILSLRKKLEREPVRPRWLVTERGRGYRIFVDAAESEGRYSQK